MDTLPATARARTCDTRCRALLTRRLSDLDPDRFEGGFMSWHSDLAATRLFESKTPFFRHGLRVRGEQPGTFRHLLGVAAARVVYTVHGWRR
jgi:hypothetical protein